MTHADSQSASDLVENASHYHVLPASQRGTEKTGIYDNLAYSLQISLFLGTGLIVLQQLQTCNTCCKGVLVCMAWLCAEDQACSPTSCMFARGQSSGETCRVWKAVHVLEVCDAVGKVGKEQLTQTTPQLCVLPCIRQDCQCQLPLRSLCQSIRQSTISHLSGGCSKPGPHEEPKQEHVCIRCLVLVETVLLYGVWGRSLWTSLTAKPAPSRKTRNVA